MTRAEELSGEQWIRLQELRLEAAKAANDPELLKEFVREHGNGGTDESGEKPSCRKAPPRTPPSKNSQDSGRSVGTAKDKAAKPPRPERHAKGMGESAAGEQPKKRWNPQMGCRIDHDPELRAAVLELFREGLTNREVTRRIRQRFGVNALGLSTTERTRRRFVSEGLIPADVMERHWPRNRKISQEILDRMLALLKDGTKPGLAYKELREEFGDAPGLKSNVIVYHWRNRWIKEGLLSAAALQTSSVGTGVSAGPSATNTPAEPPAPTKATVGAHGPAPRGTPNDGQACPGPRSGNCPTEDEDEDDRQGCRSLPEQDGQGPIPPSAYTRCINGMGRLTKPACEMYRDGWRAARLRDDRDATARLMVCARQCAWGRSSVGTGVPAGPVGAQ